MGQIDRPPRARSETYVDSCDRRGPPWSGFVPLSCTGFPDPFDYRDSWYTGKRGQAKKSVEDPEEEELEAVKEGDGRNEESSQLKLPGSP
jgi:hypothetical protein